MSGVLSLDPAAVLSTGFWMSFAAVGVITFVLAAHPAEKRAFRQLLVVQLAGSFGLAPVMLLFFRSIRGFHRSPTCSRFGG